MAAELGIDPGSLSRIERGKQAPKVPLARKIAKRYGVTLDVVFSPCEQELKRARRQKRHAA